MHLIVQIIFKLIASNNDSENIYNLLYTQNQMYKLLS